MSNQRIIGLWFFVSFQNSRCSTIKRPNENEKNQSSFFGKHFWPLGRRKIFFLDKKSCWEVSNNMFSIKYRGNCWTIDTIERFERSSSLFDTTKKVDKNCSSKSRLTSKISFESLWNSLFYFDTIRIVPLKTVPLFTTNHY